MKNLLKFVVCITATFALSCQKVNDADTPALTKDEYIAVSIGFSGEIELSEAPMARGSATKDWYAFQVYSRPQGSSEGYTQYAYGFFDNKEDMIISLRNGYEYQFDVSMAVDGSDKVYKFCLWNAGWAPINNSFVVSSTESVRYMYNGYLYMKDNETYDRPAVDRFFGQVTNFIPSEGKQVNINMKRVAFGAKFVPSNFNEGTLEINIEGSKILTMSAGQQNEIEEIVSFKYIRNAYENDTYSEEVPVNIIWVKSDGIRTPLVSETITFKRNIQTTIKFEVKDQSSTNTFDITSDENFGEGETIIANQDDINTEVNPEE